MNNRLAQLKKLANSTSTQPEYTDVLIPYSLKDVCKTRFDAKWNPRTDSWSVPIAIADQFEKVYMSDFPTPNKEQKKVLLDMGCSYDKTEKLYFLLKFQLVDLENEGSDTA